MSLGSEPIQVGTEPIQVGSEPIQVGSAPVPVDGQRAYSNVGMGSELTIHSKGSQPTASFCSTPDCAAAAALEGSKARLAALLGVLGSRPHAYVAGGEVGEALEAQGHGLPFWQLE